MNLGHLVLPVTAANAAYCLQIPDEIAGQLPGTVRVAHLVADRRGSRVWWIGLHQGPNLALKYTRPDVGEGAAVRPHAAELAAREAAVLETMANANANLVDPAYLHSHGRTGDGTWIAVKWVPHPNLRQTWNRSQRRPGKARALMVQSAYAAAAVLARMHSSGWYHGDLQAEHLLYLRGRARLIDYAFAQGPIDLMPAVPYRGGWGPVTAPELAAQLLHTPAEHNVTVTSSSEVYTLAAVLHHLWTGRHARTHRSGGLATVDIEPAGLRHLLTEMLARNPANRPSIGEVCDRLAHLTQRT